MTTKVWNDNRTGLLGCMAGNLVLGMIQKEEGEKVAHDKGTTFSTSRKTFVGRVCASNKYLQRGVIHFCNMSLTQTQSASITNKELHFLFITITDDIIHYWIIPSYIVRKVLEQTKPKPSSQTCFLRITEKNDSFFLDNKNVTQFHHTVPMKGQSTQRLAKSAAKAVALATRQSPDSKGSVNVSIKVGGTRFRGVLTPVK